MTSLSPARPPLLIEIAGRSMEPALPAGSRVWVLPCDGLARQPRSGDVVALRSGGALLVHRLVWSASFSDGARLFHRGDAGGGVGIAPADALVGGVAGVASPAEVPLPAFDRLGARARRDFRHCQARCLVFVLLRHAALRLGPAPASAWPGLARTLRRALLL
jgi:hypothetical protein